MQALIFILIKNYDFIMKLKNIEFFHEIDISQIKFKLEKLDTFDAYKVKLFQQIQETLIKDRSIASSKFKGLDVYNRF